MEKIIHQIWVGKYIIPEKDKNFSIKIKNNHSELKYMFWDNNNLPDLPPELNELKKEYEKNEEWVKIADMLRYYIVYKFGGLYLDVDYELIKPINDLNIYNYDGFLPLHYTMGDETICNSIFGFSKEHPLMKYICDNIVNNKTWLGPHFFGKYLKNYLELDEYDMDEIVSEKLLNINVKTIHSRNELKKYLVHHYSYTWHPDNQKKLEINKDYK